MTKVVGITGGIGSGKSTLVRHLRSRGFVTHDSDEEVSKIYKNPNVDFTSFLKRIGLGDSLLKNKINKKYISEKIFTNNKTKQELEKYIHKKVKIQRDNFLRKHKKTKTKVIFLDIPLLFEKNLDHLFSEIVCIKSTLEIRFQRLKKNKKINLKLFKKIIKNQVNDTIRKKRSTHMIINNDTKREFLKKINTYLEKY